MEPSLSAGDLVLMRGRASHREGEVVGYRDPMIGQVVLHRILERVDDRFVLRGDNNGFFDPTRPRESEVIGERWLTIPWAGHVVARLPRPWGPGVLALAPVMPFGGRRRLRRPGGPGEPEGQHGRPPRSVWRDGAGPPVACAVVAVGLPVVTVMAFARPTTERAAREDAYLETGAFSFRADARPGPV